MKISNRTDYALRAMVELSLAHGKKEFLSAKKIADKENIPIKFLEQILTKLKNAQYAESRLGPNGGYMLIQSPEDITFGDVIRLFEGDLAPIGCVNLENPTFCSEKWHCRFRRVMVQLRNAVSNIVDHTTFADVCIPPSGNS